MRFSQLSTAVLVGASGAFAQQYIPADVVSGNPAGVTYVATLPAQPFFKAGSLQGNVKGSVSAKAGPGGVGVQYDVQFSNIPKEGGPFSYHLHVEPCEPSGGNCTATLAHVDPFKRGEEPPCDPSQPALCQTGDLAGKYGKITSDPFTASYVDPYSSITKEIGGSFLGNRSFVFHFANKTRITCADFKLVASNSTTLPTGSAYPTTSPTTVPIAAGSSLLPSLGAVVAFAPVFAWALLI